MSVAQPVRAAAKRTRRLILSNLINDFIARLDAKPARKARRYNVCYGGRWFYCGYTNFSDES